MKHSARHLLHLSSYLWQRPVDGPLAEVLDLLLELLRRVVQRLFGGGARRRRIVLGIQGKDASRAPIQSPPENFPQNFPETDFEKYTCMNCPKQTAFYNTFT